MADGRKTEAPTSSSADNGQDCDSCSPAIKSSEAGLVNRSSSRPYHQTDAAETQEVEPPEDTIWSSFSLDIAIGEEVARPPEHGEGGDQNSTVVVCVTHRAASLLLSGGLIPGTSILKAETKIKGGCYCFFEFYSFSLFLNFSCVSLFLNFLVFLCF